MNIVTCIDLSDSTDQVVAKAQHLATALKAKLWILHVAEPEPDFVGFQAGPQSVRDTYSEEFHKEHRQIQEIAEKLRENGLDSTALLIQGPIAETLMSNAVKIQADYIVVGSHGKSALKQALVGSVSESIIRHAERPVLVVPTREQS